MADKKTNKNKNNKPVKRPEIKHERGNQRVNPIKFKNPPIPKKPKKESN